MIAPPPAAGFRLVRYFTVASLGAFAVVAVALWYLERMGDDFFEQVLQEQSLFFKQAQDGFTKQHDTATRGYLLSVHEAGSFNLTRLFANALWEKDFAPFVAKAQRIPVDRCRAIADVKDGAGKTVQPAEKQTCYAGIGKQIMAFPEFRALDAKVFVMMEKSTVFKIKVFDLRGITVYSSEHNQIGEDKIGDAGWESAVAGKPVSELTHRGKFSAFEGVVENRNLISTYLPMLAPGGKKIVGVFETYSDVTSVLDQINAASTQIGKQGAENQAQVERAAAANETKANENVNRLFAIILGLLALLYCALFLIVRNGQRIIDKEKVERERAEALLQRSEQRYRNIIQTSMEGFWIADAEGRFLDVNDAYCRLIGYEREDLLKMRIQDVEAMESPEDTARHIREIMAKGHDRFETCHRRKDGQLRDVEVSANFISDRDGGRFFAFMRDITERMRAEESLRAAAEQFRGLVEQSIAGTYIIQDGTFAYVNPRYAEILGYDSADELVGRDPLSVVAENDRGAVAENNRRRLEGEVQSISYNFAALRKDGATVEVGVHGARATYRGRPAIIGLMQDISEKKRAEDEIKRYIAQLENAFMHTVKIATTLSEMSDPYTAGHERRVGEISAAIGGELGFDARRTEGLRVAGYLHDIGKITIPREILAKPGKLSPIEFQLIQGHAQASYDVLKDVEFPWPVAEVALQHHERLDGSGYPQGLKGEAILLEARIMAVADVVEAMSSHRPYRPGLGIDKALAEIERGSGTIYDPVVAEACLKLFREKAYAIPA